MQIPNSSQPFKHVQWLCTGWRTTNSILHCNDGYTSWANEKNFSLRRNTRNYSHLLILYINARSSNWKPKRLWLGYVLQFPDGDSMNAVKSIKTETDYDRVLTEIDALMDAEP